MTSNSTTKKVNFNNIAPNPSKGISSVKDSLTSFFFGSDIMVAFTILFGLTAIAIGSVILFEKILPDMRTQFSNNIIAALAAIGFVFVILRFMGSETNILGTSFDTGMILYILIIGLLVVICSG